VEASPEVRAFVLMSSEMRALIFAKGEVNLPPYKVLKEPELPTNVLASTPPLKRALPAEIVPLTSKSFIILTTLSNSAGPITFKICWNSALPSTFKSPFRLVAPLIVSVLPTSTLPSSCTSSVVTAPFLVTKAKVKSVEERLSRYSELRFLTRVLESTTMGTVPSGACEMSWL
jgi:hypothetical protein